ncbi:hypothetical protein [Pseudomonas koreensis]|uniref:Uncharacterized protein n=1 Tax=Pseudomonas koreensis TaxID=198620 RepID=A0AA94ENW1_9PSED|nr:hypothetical protein [Pseudomonas koreensis]RVD77038.1 hypothetical protein A9HBioS_3061 [Pseudomonas koreensis]
MSQFRPGDMALIIRATHAENIGKVVELIRFDNSQKIALPEDGPRCFSPNPDQLDCWVIKGSFVARSTLRGEITCTIGASPQSWLMPLQGDCQPEQQKSLEVVE